VNAATSSAAQMREMLSPVFAISQGKFSTTKKKSMGELASLYLPIRM
jgi:hypothetical protein